MKFLTETQTEILNIVSAPKPKNEQLEITRGIVLMKEYKMMPSFGRFLERNDTQNHLSGAYFCILLFLSKMMV